MLFYHAGVLIGGLAQDSARQLLACTVMVALALHLNLRFARVLGDWTLTVTPGVALLGGVGLLQGAVFR